jgi:hypothetical protein
MLEKNNRGYAIAATLVIGSILMLLALAMFSFISNQHTGIHAIVNGEIAHFLAEAGISRCVVEVRSSIAKALTASPTNQKLKDLLMTSGQIKDTNITKLLEGNWNKELETFAKEVDKTAAIEVEVWLRSMQPTETNPSLWADPIAKIGYVTIESTGRYKSGRRTIAIKRQISVTNILPGPMAKFTLFLANAGYNAEKKYNIIKNDYKGMITDGPKPLIFYNHATPDTPSAAATGYNFSDSIREEANEALWENRGWIWLGGGKVRLNLSSGAGDLGEIFHFYDVTKPNDFSPIRFVTKENALPEAFTARNKMPWDKTSTIIRSVLYNFNHSFVLEGFHDKSSRMAEKAMYEGGILSKAEEAKYGSHSSILHLFGDARRGYQSRTKVFGNVNAAFIRFASLEVTPQEPDVEDIFKAFAPPPLYLLKSITESNYHNSVDIKEMGNREVGGPLLKTGMLFKSYAEYSQLMSKIVEQPYVNSYNSMQEVYSKANNRYFPPANTILEAEADSPIQLKSDKHLFFNGVPSINNAVTLLASRTHIQVDTIAQFWDQFINENGQLDLNAVVTIKNPENLDLFLPPSHLPQPLKVAGGGVIILEQGNLALRGVLLTSPNEALTIALKAGTSVYFANTLPNHLNIIAPEAELAYGQKLTLFGNLCVKSIYVDKRFQGGNLFYRPETDPISPSFNSFYKVYVNSKDTYWNE